jgi:rhodanese-related sulfurtransferase
MRVLQALPTTLLFLFVAVSACSDGGAEAAVGASDLAARIEAGSAPLVLDVRAQEEFAAGHIPGAVNIPHDALADRLDELQTAPADEIIVYCQSGRRAGLAESTLREHGYSNVQDLSGHWAGWTAAGLASE